MPALVEFAGDLSASSSDWQVADEVGDTDRLRFRDATSPSTERAVRVLLIGCQGKLRTHLRERLLPPQWALREAASGAEAMQMLLQEGSDVALVASSLPDLHVPELKELMQAQFPAVQVIGLDALPEDGAETAALGNLLYMDDRSLGAAPSAVRFGGETPGATGWQGMLGASAPMQRVFRMAQLVARRNTTVLIEGESGTGKDLLARGVHQASLREKQPFVVINCAAIPEALLEAELFGYTKGAFTGATQSRLGRVHAAHGGTLFLDEIGDMPLPLQSKILRFLEQGEVQRIGGSDLLKVDCRVIAATNAGLKQRVEEKLFREDLYYRLAVMPIMLPPLRDRMEDLPLLCASLLEHLCPGKRLHSQAHRCLVEHAWPGNVRELRNVIERAGLLADGREQILPEDIVL